MTEKQLRGFRDNDPYTVIQGNQWNENMYELPAINKELQQSSVSTAAPNVAMGPKQRQSKPQLCMTVLLCLILILLIIILGIVTVVYATDNNVECANTATGASSTECEFTRDSAQRLVNIVNTLSNLQDTSTSTAGVVDDILLIAQELLVLHNDSTALPTSCKEIMERQPSSPSGYYILAGHTGTYSTYCNMGTLCGSGGGWTRLAYLDMSDATQNCPSGFRLYQSGGVRACGRPVTSSGSCVSVQFPSNGISYSQICGRVVGHSHYTPDAVNSDILGTTNHANISSYYVDGVSITRGSPRQHVWTLMAGHNNFVHNGRFSCPCANGSSQVPQSFVGSHYFCEGALGNFNDLLWDGKDCSFNETACCSAPGLPWFHRDYGSTATTDYIELRVCGDQETADEDVPVSFYEIYIK
uniref:Fibrinogen C-terminal domain-containing protein n=1 Tax=Amphimedon queenslandica TaxID=400682 RepID=A0A1X7TMK2_AMPQE